MRGYMANLVCYRASGRNEVFYDDGGGRGRRKK